MPRVIVSFACLWEGSQPPEKNDENEGLQECRRARVQVHPTLFSLRFLSLSSVALFSFWLFRLITYLEVSPAFGVTVKTAPCLSRYSHRESHHVHRARCLCLKPQENSHSASPSIKVYLMPVFCTRLWNEQVFPCTFSIYTQTGGSLCRL